MNTNIGIHTEPHDKDLFKFGSVNLNNARLWIDVGGTPPNFTIFLERYQLQDLISESLKYLEENPLKEEVNEPEIVAVGDETKDAID